MNIGSSKGYPSSALSNFAPHPFVFDGVECASMEGLLQSFKKKNPDVQVEVCKLVGIKAKRAGGRSWKRTQTLWWKGEAFDRDSDEYQELLDRAFNALAENESFQRALIASGDAVLTHTIGKRKTSDTCLTRREFCSRLTSIRNRLQKEIE
jgi:hypothetical protein